MWAWLVSIIGPWIEKIGYVLIADVLKWLAEKVSSLWARHEKEINQEEQAKTDRAVINNPAATPEERKDAEGNVLNS